MLKTKNNHPGSAYFSSPATNLIGHFILSLKKSNGNRFGYFKSNPEDKLTDGLQQLYQSEAKAS